MNIFKRIFCSHKDVKDVYLRDIVLDSISDNDDLEDFPTINKVTYCERCGKINNICVYSCDSDKESTFSEIEHFERITGKRAQDITLI